MTIPAELYHFIAFAIALVVVWWSTPVIRRLSLEKGIGVDRPNHRKVHAQPMVRLGGVSIFTGFLVSLLVVWGLGGFDLPPKQEWEIWGVTLGALAFFAIGLADDLLGLPAITRLIMQIAVATVTWQMGVRIDFISIPFDGLIQISWLSLPITVLWLVGMVNAINWIDGLDGLAAGVCGISAVVMLILSLFMNQPAAALIAAALAGGSLGFLRYNFNPAQIFMGDGGAYFMGFTLAGVGVVGLVKTAAFTTVAVTAVLLPYLVLAVPLVDMSAVIISRVTKGKSPFIADKRHLHHRLLNAGISHRQTVLFIYALTLWVGSLALGFSNIPSGWGYAIASTVLLIYLGWQAWRNRQKSQE